MPGSVPVFSVWKEKTCSWVNMLWNVNSLHDNSPVSSFRLSSAGRTLGRLKGGRRLIRVINQKRINPNFLGLAGLKCSRGRTGDDLKAVFFPKHGTVRGVSSHLLFMALLKDRLKYIEKRHWITFSIPLSFTWVKGSMWADPVGQMCGRCRPYRSAAPGRFARLCYIRSYRKRGEE